MVNIRELKAREILDSRGNPTVEVDAILDDGIQGRAGVPSGASTGEFEAIELRDGDKKRFNGKGVQKVIQNIRKQIAPALTNLDATEQSLIDNTLIQLDGTPNKSRLGANATLAVSIAVARAAANHLGKSLHAYLGQGKGITLPVPFMNIVNGGAHADNKIDFQEFMIVPAGFPTFSDSLRAGVEVFHALKSILKKGGHSTGVGDEGGFAPDLGSVEETLDVILKAVKLAGYKEKKEIALALDVAASELREDDAYRFKKGGGKPQTTNHMIGFYEKLAKNYPIVSIEDGLAEDDWDGWRELTSRLGARMQIVGDDLFVTNCARLKDGIEKKAANSILIKLNQIGTVTETLETVMMAKECSYTTVISHRSGETEDTTIADFAVAVNAGMIKTGSASRTDRLAKYNQLLRIEEELGESGHFAGFKAIHPCTSNR